MTAARPAPAAPAPPDSRDVAVEGVAAAEPIEKVLVVGDRQAAPIIAEATSAHVAMRPAPPAPRRRRTATVDSAPAPKKRSARTRWALGAVCALALVSLTLGGRERLVAKVAGADRVFAAIGLPVNLSGLEFRNVASRVAEIDGRKVLAVTGDLVNIRTASVSAPAIRITARGADGRALYVWTTNASSAKLAPGETASFRTRLAAPPEDARDVLVAFAEPLQLASAVTAQDGAVSGAKGRPGAK